MSRPPRKPSRATRPWISPKGLVVGLIAVGVLFVGLRFGLGGFPRNGADSGAGPGPRGDSASRPAIDPAELGEIPHTDPTDMEPRVVSALETARRAVEEDPLSADFWGRYGVTCDAHDLFAPAAQCYRAAARLAPTEFKWHYFLGRVQEILGVEPDSVFASFERARELRPDYAPGHVRRGDSLARGGRAEEAKTAFEEALALDPGLARAHRGLGQALLTLGDAEGACARLEEAARLDPGDGGIQITLAQALARTGRREAARQAQARARDLPRIKTFADPILAEIGMAGISADACLRRSQEWLDRGDFRRAARDCEIALETRPDDPAIHVRLVTAYRGSGRSGDAIRSLARVVELVPESTEYRIALAELLIAARRLQEAVDQLRGADELAGGTDASIAARLGSALAQHGRVEEALATFERAAASGDLAASDHLNWGTALAQAGDFRAAVARFADVIRIDPGSANAHFNWGLCLEQMGEPREAVRHYARAAAIDPRHRAARRLAEMEQEDGESDGF